MIRRSNLRIGDSLKTPENKRRFNEQLFQEIAPNYDFINRVLSFWCDGAWKRDLIAALPTFPAPNCLDLACGTGDITFLLARRYAQASIIGLDITEAMLDRARRRNQFQQVRFVNQDMGRLDFPDESFDIITGSYALRNAPDLNGTLLEIRRVLKTNGVCAFLDFSKPPGRLPQKVEFGLLNMWTGFWGLLLHRNPEVYGYIVESLRLFPDRAQLRRVLNRNNFIVTSSRLYFFGIIELLVIRKVTTGPD